MMLSLGWLGAVVISLWWWWDAFVTHFIFIGPDSRTDAEVQADASLHAAALLRLTITLAGGPVLISATAFAGRLPRAGRVYLAMAMIIGVCAAPPAWSAYRTLNPPPPAQPEPVICQNRSGGEPDCPGG